MVGTRIILALARVKSMHTAYLSRWLSHFFTFHQLLIDLICLVNKSLNYNKSMYEK